MKRILLLGIILVICILAMPQGVMALEYADVTANVDSVLELDVTGPSEWLLTTGEVNVNPDAIDYTIIANSPWSVTIVPTPDDGIMAATLTDHVLGSVLEIETIPDGVPSGSYLPVITTAKILSDDITAEAGNPYSANLQQDVAWTDERLTETGDVYKITLTFTIAQDVLSG